MNSNNLQGNDIKWFTDISWSLNLMFEACDEAPSFLLRDLLLNFMWESKICLAYRCLFAKTHFDYLVWDIGRIKYGTIDDPKYGLGEGCV